jgi:uncharacterized protein YbjT (DUF2867 family)
MQDKDKKTILVTGATGKQGGAVLRHLVNHGWHVRVICRDPNKSSAQACTDMGVEVVKGDLDDRNSVLRAAKGTYGIYSVQAIEKGPEVEFRQGKTLADVARECGVKHFVYSSVGGADRNTGVPYFDSKWQIEQHINSLKLPATIFRPVWFMDNFLIPQFRSSILEGSLSLPLRPDKKLQMIAVDNIGGFVALAFEKPEQYIGKTYEIAGDELTLPQITQKLSRVIEHNVRYVEMPLEQMRASNPGYAKMFEWFNEYGYNADISKLRQMLPELLDFEAWLHKFGWEHFVREEAAVGARR